MWNQYLIVEGRCNLKCKYCWYSTESAHFAKTTVQPAHLRDWLTACLLCEPVGALIITGGEPLLRDNLYDFVIIGKKLGLAVALLTNGTLLTERWARLLRDADVDTYVSLDSIEPLYHESLRGGFDSTIRGLKYLYEAGVPHKTITTTVSRANLGGLRGLVEYAKAHEFDIRFQPIAVPTTDPLSLARSSPEERRQLYKVLLPWAQERNKIRYLGLIASVVNTGSPVQLSWCATASHGLVIDSDGTIFPCFQRKGISLGNIMWSPPSVVLEKRKKLLAVDPPGGCIKTDCLGLFTWV